MKLSPSLYIWCSISYVLAQVLGAEQAEQPSTPVCIPTPLKVPERGATPVPKRVIIAHRGASSHLPEHTLAAYRLALELNADYIEPDLVSTSDNQLIAIHSVDLNTTSDVAEKFPKRETFSKYLNRTGYWSYEFTLKEIKTLRVRQRLPAARSTAYDGLFEIPTLTEILELILNWNTNVEPFIVNLTTTMSAKPGVYAELKDFPWLLEDADIDLIDLLFQHIQDNEDLWQSAVMERLCSTKQLKVHEYRLPPLVMQSFEGTVLKSFATTWETVFANSAQHPVPPMVLLVSHEKCVDDKFWFQVGEDWRDIVSGVGPDKECFFNQEGREFMEHAEKLDLAVHPWTARPELEFVGGEDNAMPFETVLDEILYLFCTVGVHGIFSESVEMAVVAANIVCPDKTKNEPSQPQEKETARSSGNSICTETSQPGANFYVGLSSFVMGFVLSVLLGLFFKRGSRGQRELRVATEEAPHQNDDDMEML